MKTIQETYQEGMDLVARIAHTADQGWVPYDTDVSYLFQDREDWGTITEDEVKEAMQLEETDIFYFARWEWPDEWSML